MPSSSSEPPRRTEHDVRIRMLPPIDPTMMSRIDPSKIARQAIFAPGVRQAFRAMQKDWTPITPVMPSSNVLKAVQQAIREQQKMMDGIAQTVAGPINAAVNNMFEVRKQMLATISTTEPIVGSLARLHEVMLGFAERARQWDEDQHDLLVVLAPRGWLLSPSLTMDAPREMLEFAEAHGLDALEEELIGMFDADYLEKILNGCYNRPSFETWKPTFTMALNAHRRGEYALAIPIWLAAIDGIIEDELGVRRVYSRIRKRRRNPVRAAFADAWPDALLDGLLRVLLEVAKQEPSIVTRSTNPVVARHPILHGRKPQIGDERDSIQCVLMLEVMHLLISVREHRADKAA